MELSDFTGLFLLAALIAAPLGSIYFSIRKIGWDSSRGLFLDAILVWLAWMTSYLWIGLFFIVIDAYTRLSFMVPGFPLVALLAGFIGSTAAVAVLIRYFLNRNSEPKLSIAWQPNHDGPVKLSALRISFAAVASATRTFLLFLGVLNLDKIYDYYYPPPPPADRFRIYDI